MSARRRGAVLAVVIAALVAGVVAIVVASEPPPEERDSRSAFTAAPARGAAGERVLRRLREHVEAKAEAHEARETRRVVGDPTAEADARDQEVATFAGERAEAEPVARRFFAAFAEYELGELSARVERELRATSTASFARGLLATRPPRIPAGTVAPVPARLVGLELVPGESRGRELVSLEFVAAVARGAERTPLAITLRRQPARGWRVEGLGR